jgi:hypothetical protein
MFIGNPQAKEVNINFIPLIGLVFYQFKPFIGLVFCKY